MITLSTDGEQMELGEGVAGHLQVRGLIYRCHHDDDCRGFWHLANDISWDRIVSEIAAYEEASATPR